MIPDQSTPFLPRKSALNGHQHGRNWIVQGSSAWYDHLHSFHLSPSLTLQAAQKYLTGVTPTHILGLDNKMNNVARILSRKKKKVCARGL